MIEGVKTTIPFHLKLMNHPIFAKGTFDIKFLEDHDINGDSEPVADNGFSL
jgi:acetyl-CoA carboxylase biotin carboxylase subunit